MSVHLNIILMNLVQIMGSEPTTTTLIIAEGMNLDHRAVMALVDKNTKDMEELGSFAFEMRKSKGRPLRFAYLNECQTTYLITLMRNSQIVKKFKKELTKEFFKQRKLIAHLLTQRQNASWIEQRKQGLVARREETDVIKEFVEYATKQGSTQAHRYYGNLSKMENAALFFLEQKFPNIRDVLSGYQLSIIASADIVVSRALSHGMRYNMYYKDIYKLAKQRVEGFSELVGKTQVPLQPALTS